MSDDDVWGSETIVGEEGNRQGSHLHSELDHEWQARHNQFHTLGYRDGVEAGKNSSVQEGFNLGYAEATVAGFTWGVARGLTRAFAALPDSLKDTLVGESDVRGHLEALDSSIYRYSSTDSLRTFHRNINKIREVSVSSSDTVLESQNIEEIGRLDLESQREGGIRMTSFSGGSLLPHSCLNVTNLYRDFLTRLVLIATTSRIIHVKEC
uniref:Essential protein Yae1 N-terminal domain-containing protein n=1 Tax=Physcomitrium patens TaxID=3218 RepID=A0A7I4DTB5_PHYPA